MLPKAPNWFVRNLKKVDPSLRVSHSGPGGWVIHQIDRKPAYRGRWNGANIYEITDVPIYVAKFPELGSRIFYILRKAWIGNYSGYNEFCKVNRVKTEEDQIRIEDYVEKEIAHLLKENRGRYSTD